MPKKEFNVGDKIKLGNLTLLVKNAQGYECGDCFFKRLCDKNLFDEVTDMVGDCVFGKNVTFIKLDDE